MEGINENTVLLSEIPSIWYEIKPDDRRRYHFNQTEILNYLKNNNMTFAELAKKYKFDKESYDNIRRALIRAGGMRGKSFKQAQINTSFKKEEMYLYDKFRNLCFNDRKKPSQVIKEFMEYCTKNNTIKI